MPKRVLAAMLFWMAASPAHATVAESFVCPPPQRVQVSGDDFHHGLTKWRVEAQDARAQVQAKGGTLQWQTPAGLTLWWHQPLQGDWQVRFTATPGPAPQTAGALGGRVSDLNMFWNATEADGSLPKERDGSFASHDSLHTWYLGFGANGNRTTRLRHYGGTAQTRSLLDGWADAGEATPEDARGAMTPATSLQAGRPLQVQIVSRRPTPDDPVHLRWWANGVLLFERRGLPMRLQGSFALRSTASSFQISGFEVTQCTSP